MYFLYFLIIKKLFNIEVEEKQDKVTTAESGNEQRVKEWKMFWRWYKHESDDQYHFNHHRRDETENHELFEGFSAVVFVDSP